jgi:hypothetical protein
MPEAGQQHNVWLGDGIRLDKPSPPSQYCPFTAPSPTARVFVPQNTKDDQWKGQDSSKRGHELGQVASTSLANRDTHVIPRGDLTIFKGLDLGPASTRHKGTYTPSLYLAPATASRQALQPRRLFSDVVMLDSAICNRQYMDFESTCLKGFRSANQPTPSDPSGHARPTFLQARNLTSPFMGVEWQEFL